jgi:hypothetical protein
VALSPNRDTLAFLISDPGGIQMQRTVWVAALLLAAASPALAEDKPPIVARAEKCLADNVDRVVAVEPDIQSAASFLVNFACANEVAGVARYERNKLSVQMMNGMFKAMPQFMWQAKPDDPKAAAPPQFPEATVDPDTGEIVIPPSPPGAQANPFAAMMPQVASASMSQMGADSPPPALRKLAGELVLAARQRAKAR